MRPTSACSREWREVRLRAGHGDHRHQARAVSEQCAVTLPVAGASGGPGEYFIGGMQYPIKGGNVRLKHGFHRRVILVYECMLRSDVKYRFVIDMESLRS
jgi:hypothetical protein